MSHGLAHARESERERARRCVDHSLSGAQQPCSPCLVNHMERWKVLHDFESENMDRGRRGLVGASASLQDNGKRFLLTGANNAAYRGVGTRFNINHGFRSAE